MDILKEVKNFYRIIPLKYLRRTPGVYFDYVPMKTIKRVDAIDRVIHKRGAISPGKTAYVKRPWYMHTHQDDNLMVLSGVRYVDIYTKETGMEKFIVTPDSVKMRGKTIYKGPAMLVWSRKVFHRIKSSDKYGSISVNFAVRYKGFDIKKNFNIYDLDTKTGKYSVIREGFRDQ